MATDLSTFQAALVPYRSMMRELVRGEISPDGFARNYMDKYLPDPTDWDDDLFEILDRVFAMSDCLEIDPEMREDVIFAKSPEELVDSVIEAMTKLDELVPPQASK